MLALSQAYAKHCAQLVQPLIAAIEKPESRSTDGFA
jgi:hypothetical protein